MAYTKTTWVNGQAPAIDADNLNKIENGIFNNANAIDTINNKLPDSGTQVLASGITYRKKNGFVYISGYINGQSYASLTTTYKTLGSMPSGYTPAETIYHTWVTTMSLAGVVYIAADGTLGAKTFSGTCGTYWFDFFYPVSD